MNCESVILGYFCVTIEMQVSPGCASYHSVQFGAVADWFGDTQVTVGFAVVVVGFGDGAGVLQRISRVRGS